MDLHEEVELIARRVANPSSQQLEPEPENTPQQRKDNEEDRGPCASSFCTSANGRYTPTSNGCQEHTFEDDASPSLTNQRAHPHQIVCHFVQDFSFMGSWIPIRPPVHGSEQNASQEQESGEISSIATDDDASMLADNLQRWLEDMFDDPFVAVGLGEGNGLENDRRSGSLRIATCSSASESKVA